MKPSIYMLALGIMAAAASVAVGQSIEPTSFRFAFGTAQPPEGFVAVATDAAFSNERGFGFEAGATLTATEHAVASEQPFLFSAVVPEGSYRVTLTLGCGETGAGESVMTIKSESRRLMLEGVAIPDGATVVRTIAVNVRNRSVPPPERNAPGGTEVVLSEREVSAPHWDDKLTLEFNGTHPALQRIEIVRDDTLPTVFLVGDSTVTDQPGGDFASWGQMLPRFLKPDVVVANHAQSGETMKSFISGLRLAKVLSQMKAGDYLFIQFGHNDSKKQWPQTYAAAGSTYNAYLNAFIAEARLRGATPVLVTSMQRRQFDENGKVRNSHGDYPDAVRQVAREEGVALIDLEAMSRAFYEALGPERSPLAFANRGRDATHHNAYGAYELAKCIMQGIRENAAQLSLAASIVDDFAGFDPSHPDDVDAFNRSFPASPGPERVERPRGN